MDNNKIDEIENKSKQKKKKMKKNNKIKKFVVIFLTIFLIFSTLYIGYSISLYNSIETLIRVLGCITLVVFTLLLWVLLLKFQKKIKSKVFIVLTIISLLYCGTLLFVGNKINNVYKQISKISSNNYDVYSTSIITRSNLDADDISDVKSNKIGIINDEDDYQGYTLGNKILSENNINNTVRYNDYIEMINDLINKKIDFAVVPTNYEAQVSGEDGIEDVGEKTKIIYTKEEKKEKKITNKTIKSLDEPFTVLIMGVDTVSDGFTSGFNGDALILVTFNPKTTNATILSIPRDTYMPIACMKDRKNKITNAGWRGQDCIISSLENYFDIKIDYHVKINFNGVVSLVDALGGVEVDVPYSFCEQNSKRKFGKNTIFVDEGKQTLNGEEALAFARHRKVTSYMVNYCGPKYVTNANYWNDFTRGQNQQIIINALLNKLKNINSFDTIEDLLKTISNNVETDISTNSILSLYNLGKDIIKKSANKDEALNMQRLYLSGKDARIYDYSFATNSGSRLMLYNYVAYEESKEAVVNAMKENLELKEVTPVTTFSFSIKDEYKETVIGKNIGSTANLTLLPNFVGSNVSKVETFALENDINLNIEYVAGTKNQFIGQVLKQSAPSGTDIDMLDSGKNLTVTVVDEISDDAPIEDENLDIDNNTDNIDPDDNTDDTLPNEDEENNDDDVLDDILPNDDDTLSNVTSNSNSNSTPTDNTESNKDSNSEENNSTPSESKDNTNQTSSANPTN